MAEEPPEKPDGPTPKPEKKAKKPKLVRGPEDGKRGPLRQKLTEQQQDEILKLIRSGFKRISACENAKPEKVDYWAFCREYKRDREFRLAVLIAESFRGEQLHTVLYSSAMDGDMITARFLHEKEIHSIEMNRAHREAVKARKAIAGAQGGGTPPSDPNEAADWRAFRALRALERAERAAETGTTDAAGSES